MDPSIEPAARHYAAGALGEAASACRDIINADPRHFDALHLLGVICLNRGLHADALSYLLRAAAERPDDPALRINLGNAYKALERFEEALACYTGAADPGALNNRGLAQMGLERHRAAVETFQAAISQDPTHLPAWFNLGRALMELGRFEEAEAAYNHVLASGAEVLPADREAAAMIELARTFLCQHRAKDAIEQLRLVTARFPDRPPPEWNLSLALLTAGHLAEGFRAYESRFGLPGHDERHPDHCVLDLDTVEGKRVLVTSEQGRGDVIQCLRYLRPLAERGARIHLSIYDDLAALARELPDIESVVTGLDAEPPYDLRTSIMSLPLAFGTEPGRVPAETPYLRVPAAQYGRMRRLLGPAKGIRIGLAWSGSAASYRRAAMPAAMTRPLLDIEGLEFHCLQKDIRAEDRAGLDPRIVAYDSILRDFADTAALIDAMDLVVTIDTAVAHLAGALGKPVWIMLPLNPDWRWLLGREDSPWYPTARLFRQTQYGVWSDVIGRIGAALRV